MYKESINVTEELATIQGKQELAKSMKTAYARGGNKDALRSRLEFSKDRRKAGSFIAFWDEALLQAQLGNKDLALEALEKGYLAFPEAAFDGVWASFSLLHIRASEVRRTLFGFRSVLRERGLFFAAVHRGPKTEWVKTTISGMERDTYVQEWLQTDIEAVVREAGFEIIGSRPFERAGGRYPLLSILAHK
jgi:hypothetical protein